MSKTCNKRKSEKWIHERAQRYKCKNCGCNYAGGENSYPEDIKQEAISFLSRKSLSEKELKYKLKKKFGDLDFDPVIHRMRSLNFLNDNELAKFELKKMSERKFYSNSKIKAHMNSKGLKSEFLEFPENEKERALNLLKKKYKIRSEKNKNRACKLLFSYGYSSSIVWECVNEYFC